MAGGDTWRMVRYEFTQALLFFEIPGDLDNVLVCTRVTLLGDLLPNSGGVPTAFLPALEYV
jgi:hypothetical protein